jgi:Mg2+ and Co2+ transporter CorA
MTYVWLIVGVVAVCGAAVLAIFWTKRKREKLMGRRG